MSFIERRLHTLGQLEVIVVTATVKHSIDTVQLGHSIRNRSAPKAMHAPAHVHNSTVTNFLQSNYLTGSIFLRAAFKFGRGVHFVLRRKMRKPPISRVPTMLNRLTNRPS